MPRFSANLGFLWPDLSLPEAIRAAHAAGFDAVECHWPFETAIEEVQAALADTGLKMLGLNTRRGDISAGDNGLAAQPGREPEARAAIDEAIKGFGVYAVKVPLDGDDGDYTMDHTATVFLYDQTGALSGTIAWGERADFAREKLKRLISG